MPPRRSINPTIRNDNRTGDFCFMKRLLVERVTPKYENHHEAREWQIVPAPC